MSKNTISKDEAANRKTSKKKEKGPVVFNLLPVDVFCPRTAQNTLRGVFRPMKGTPTFKSVVFNTPQGPVNVWRESEKGFAAKWYCSDAKTLKTFEGTKTDAVSDAAYRIALAYRQGKIG